MVVCLRGWGSEVCFHNSKRRLKKYLSNKLGVSNGLMKVQLYNKKIRKLTFQALAVRRLLANSKRQLHHYFTVEIWPLSKLV